MAISPSNTKKPKDATFTLTVLGSGTSSGVPLIGCPCSVCRSKDPKNKRLRASVWIQYRGKSFLIDTSVDLREQALRNKIPRVDAVLYTHPHSDHITGIDEMRAFNFHQNASIPVYGNEWTMRELSQRYRYIFEPGTVEGGGIPRLIPHLLDPYLESIEIEGVPFTPIPVPHGSQECVGYRVGPVAYMTDCHEIPMLARSRLQGLEVLILDCVRIKPHRTHLNLEAALTIVEELKPKRVFLTHLGHDFEYKRTNKKLPKGVRLAFDGLKIVVQSEKMVPHLKMKSRIK